MKLNWLILSLIMVLSSSVAFGAVGFEVSINPIKDTIAIDQTGSFEIVIMNTGDKEDVYTLTFSDVGLWDQYYTNPLADYFSGMKIKALDSYKTTVYLKPNADIGVGSHDVEFNIKSRQSKNSQRNIVPIYIKSSALNDEYNPAIKGTIIWDNQIDPRHDNSLVLKIENRNRRNIAELEVRIESQLINKDFTTALAPLEKKEIDIPIVFDAILQPQQDEVSVTLTIPGFRPIWLPKVSYEVIDYTTELSQVIEESKSFFKYTKLVTLTNNGNRNQSQLFSERTSLFASLFKSEKPDYSWVAKQDGMRYRVWDITVEPGKSSTMTLVTNYRSIVYVIILSIVLVILYFAMKSPLRITKHAKNVEMREGGISEIKVLLNVRNMSSHPVQHLTVIDDIPYIASLSADFEAGTIRPTKTMQHSSSSKTIVQWSIDELDPHEDRLITYRIKSKLPILGQFKLPSAIVKYSTKSGKRLRVNSNKLMVR